MAVKKISTKKVVKKKSLNESKTEKLVRDLIEENKYHEDSDLFIDEKIFQRGHK